MATYYVANSPTPGALDHKVEANSPEEALQKILNIGKLPQAKPGDEWAVLSNVKLDPKAQDGWLWACSKIVTIPDKKPTKKDVLDIDLDFMLDL